MREQRQPAINDETLARWLGTLGQSELATSMIAIALAAQSGAMPVTPELTDKTDALAGVLPRTRLEDAGRAGPK